MKKILIATLLASAFSVCTFGQTTPKGPTMGWSSWNTYGCNISANLIKSQANAMVSQGFKSVGYQYINIDDGFQGGRNKETGELLINKSRFPNGLKEVADYIHNKGLKAGIYSDAGHNTCGNYYNGDKLSVHVGMYEYDNHDANMYFNEMGFDFIKVDFCGGDAPQNTERLSLDEQTRYTDIWNAIQATGRKDIRYNVCRWDYPGTWVHDVSTSWRISHDIACDWNSVKDIINQSLYLSAYCYDGCYNDMDMLEVGRTLSVEEDKTHFGIWCIMASPLLIGCNMSNINTTAKNLLKNTELIAINQDTLYLQAYVAKRIGDTYVLVKDLEKKYGNKRAVAFYNSTDQSATMSVDFATLELSGKIKMRDLYAKRDLEDAEESFTITVPAHGTRIYTIEGEQRLERTRYEAETAYLSSYQEIKNNQAMETAVYSSDGNCSGGMKAGWLGKKAKNDIQWRNVYSQNGGDYNMQIAYISGENRSFTLEVNGKRIGTYTVNSNGWGNVATKSMKVSLQPGENIVRLYNSSAWMPDIDYMNITPIEQPNDIHSHTINNTNPDNELYTLSGQKANASTKGIVISKNRKYVK